MREYRVRRSPWWYRHRGFVIAVVYGAGFLIGSISLDGQPQQPVCLALGRRFADGNGEPAVLWFAVACALAAWFWRASGTAYLRTRVVAAADVQSDRLIVAGPFRYVRNPLYVGNMFLALAIAVLAPPLGFVLILVGNAVVVWLLAAEESRRLAKIFGPVYAAFLTAVPAFVPRVTPATVIGSVSVEPSWRAALVAEAFCLALALAIVPIALFGQAGLLAFWAIWGSALVVYVGLGWRAGRRANSVKY